MKNLLGNEKSSYINRLYISPFLCLRDEFWKSIRSPYIEFPSVNSWLTWEFPFGLENMIEETIKEGTL